MLLSRSACLLCAALIWGLIQGTQCTVNGGQDVTTVSISPGETLRSQTIDIGNQTIWYRPTGLLPSQGYELRVSVPATNPVNVILWLEEGEESKGALALRSTKGHRALLDAEKIVFITGPNGGIVLNSQENVHAVVGFRAMPRGVFQKDLARFPVLYYGIILERNVVGIPFSAWPLLLTAVVVVLIILAFIPYWSETLVPALAAWLGASQAISTSRLSKVS